MIKIASLKSEESDYIFLIIFQENYKEEE